MLYKILKIWVWLAAKIFCRKIIINKAELLKIKGPVLLAANHPNSFLDAVLLDILFEQPIWSLARGDVFKKPLYIKLLHRLKMFPVYRTSEGVENLSNNYTTFDACKDVFRKNGLVLMFSEGKCINEWHLRPLMKGTARLSISSWEDGIKLQVLPVGINYSSFYTFGKNVFINFGNLITSDVIAGVDSDGKRHLAFNQALQNELATLVVEIPLKDEALRKEKLSVNVSAWKKYLLLLPAVLGFLLNAPLYLPLRTFTKSRTAKNDHYDSVLLALLIFSYPLYLLLVFMLLFLLLKNVVLAAIILLFLPFSAWAYVQVKKQF